MQANHNIIVLCYTKKELIKSFKIVNQRRNKTLRLMLDMFLNFIVFDMF